MSVTNKLIAGLQRFRDTHEDFDEQFVIEWPCAKFLSPARIGAPVTSAVCVIMRGKKGVLLEKMYIDHF